MPFLLMVFLVLVCMPEPEIWPKPLWTDSPLACVAAAWLIVLSIGMHAYCVAYRFRKPLQKEPALREQLLVRYERGRFRQHSALFVLYILILLGLGWGSCGAGTAGRCPVPSCSFYRRSLLPSCWPGRPTTMRNARRIRRPIA